MTWFGDLTLRIFPRLAANGPFNNHSTLTNGLVSYWKLDEQSGTRYDSITATGNDLTDNNTVTYDVAGPTGVAAYFASSNGEYLSGASYNNLPLSASVWFTLDSPTTRVNLIGNYVAASFSGWSLEHSASGTIELWYFKDGSNYNSYTTGVPFNYFGKWNHAVVTIDAAGAGKIYVNGVLGASPTWDTGTPGVSTQAAGVSIGLMSGAGTWNGRIARGGVWNEVLDPARVTSLFNSGNGKDYAAMTTAEKTGLVSFWNLDEASGTRADSHGSNTLTDNNTVTSATNDAPPPKNVAAQFTAANSEYLSKADTNDSLDPGNTDFTWAMWLYPTVSGGTDYFFGKTSGCSTTTTPYYLVQNSNDTVTVGIANGTTENTLASIQTLTINGWNLVVAWHDADTDLGISINGTETTRGISPSIDVYQNAAAVTFGTLSPACPASLFWSGNIDESGFWNRVLTAQERTDLWNSGDGLYY